MEDTIKISLSSVLSQPSKKNINLDGYIEIHHKYLNFFKNTWIKYSDKHNLISYAGGNLYSVENDTVVLKNIKGTVFELKVDEYIFYCKETTEQYKALKNIIIEMEKIDIERRVLQEEKNKFMKQKRDFFLKYKIKD
jgi:hypothetical protein